MGDRVHQFVSGLGPHLIKKCLTASLQEGMNISRIQAHAQNLKEQQQLQRGERDSDRGKRFDHSNYSGPGQSSTVWGSQYGGESGQMRPPLPQCNQCGKPHSELCRLGSDVCNSCGQPGHIMRKCPFLGRRRMVQSTGLLSSVCPPGRYTQTSAGCDRGRGGASGLSSLQSLIYALTGRQDLESSPDVITGILSVFSYDVYSFVDLGSVLLYITPYISGLIGAKLELTKAFTMLH
ncbi:uncharacterized protein LOC132053785 [Lycium ferocissimum]|uniref:uncharacterized protein LOC132053785 n=1 Tax=Lycium ferocissimum TaxID=112874 RepID=UPI0028154EFB|nr:uncharacterized protein LOC132053785 [Lycium ferocissimum]